MGESKVTPDVSKFSVLPFYIVFLLPLAFVVAHVFKWSAAGTFFVFVMIPVGDLLFGRDNVNPTKEEAKVLDGQFKFRLVTWIWIPVHLVMVFGSIHLTYGYDISLWQKINFAITAGILTGVAGFNTGHELNHKRNKFEEFLAHVLFCTLSYDHFAYEHNLGHHWNVATPRDPATSRLGENFYAFFPRTFFGSIKSSWNIERELLAKQGKGVFSPSNRIIRGYIIEASIIAALGYVYGLHGPLMYLLQCFMAILLLESTNYIEHYGLLRERYPDGSYEPVDPFHSWNAAESFTNYMLFKLERHSDHHTYPYKRYQTLISHEHVAQLPTGYPGMILLALVPPLFFKIMNPRVFKLKSALEEKKKIEATLTDTTLTQKGKAIKGN